MSTLTKIFVVLLVVFSIAFTSMTISMVVRTANWRETAQKYQEHARIADTNLRHQAAACAAIEAAANDRVRDYQKKVSELEVQVGEARRKAAEVQEDLSRAASEKSRAEAMNQGLVAQLQVTDAARAEYKSQRDELESRNLELERRNIDLSDRVNELTSGTAVLLEQKRQYEQQLHMLREENEKLAQQAQQPSAGATLESPEAVAVPHATPLTPMSTTAIRGRVLQISGDLVTISVGGADGVEQGMVFVIHRKGQYIADLKISVVEPNQSAGRIIRAAGNATVDDEVTDALSLTSSRG